MQYNQNKSIPSVIVYRLPKYYRYLEELIKEGVERISSGELSVALGITASQIRQDLNHFGGFGHQGYGYHVRYLHSNIGEILGLNQKRSLIIIGIGRLGYALATYPRAEFRNFTLKALFDDNPNMIGQEINDLVVEPMDHLEAYLKKNPTDITVLSLPKENAKDAAERVAKLGVHGIWNFTTAELDLQDAGVAVENCYLTDSLMALSYKLENQN